MRGTYLQVTMLVGASGILGRSINSPFFFGRPWGGLITWRVVAREERRPAPGCPVNRAQLDSGEEAGVPELS